MHKGLNALRGFALAAIMVAPVIGWAGCGTGDYTTAQAATGQKLYDANCAACHMSNLAGGSGPALEGAKFKSYLDFTKISADQLLSFISSQMPYQAPGSLKTDEYNAIFAYILKYNNYPAGSVALDAKTASCVKMRPYPGHS